jgi:hypothetical protein
LDRKLYQEALIEPRRIVPGISKQVNRAILKGMELEPEDRPQSMQAWLKQLDISKVFTPLSNYKVKYYSLNNINEYLNDISAKNPKIMFFVFIFYLLVVGVPIASVIHQTYVNMKIKTQEYEALKTVLMMNREQQKNFFENGKYSKSKHELSLLINNTEQYIYSSHISTIKQPESLLNKSIGKLGFALGISNSNTKTDIQGVFNYGISRNNKLKSYVGAVVVRELSKIDEPITLSILCESKSLDTPPPEPIYKNGKLACSSGTQEVSP